MMICCFLHFASSSLHRSSEMKKSSIVASLFLLAFCGWWVSRGTTEPQPAETETVTAPTPAPERPLADFRFGRPRVLAEHPTEGEVATFRTVLERAVSRAHIVSKTRVGLTSGGVIAKIHAAQAIIDSVEVQDSWSWHEVQAVVRGIGTTYPLVEFAHDEVYPGLFARYVSYEECFVIASAEFSRLSVEEVAETLVHEATHAVFGRHWKNESGFTRDELVLLEMRCAELSAPLRIMNEGLAWSNQAAWHRWRHQGHILASVYPDVDRMLHEASDFAHVRPFAQELVAYTLNMERHGTNARADHDRCCLPLVAVRGPHAGEWFSPADLNPGFALPLFRAAFGP